MKEFEIRPLTAADWTSQADLIYRSLNTWYREHRGFDLVTGPVDSMLLFPKVYESLDPGCCLTAVDPDNGRMAASCFYHPRKTHLSLGMMNVHPDYFGKGAGSAVLRRIIETAQKKGLPVRLVSSAMNLESFALYNRYGFKPFQFFQDMTLPIPSGGFSIDPPQGMTIRDAAEEDIPAAAALEKEMCGIEREEDWRFFRENAHRIWGLSVCVDSEGAVCGACASVCDPGSHMIGPGIARSEVVMGALIQYEANRYPGKTPVVLIPSDAVSLRRTLFALGGRICEMHITQVLGEAQKPAGIVLPSFMPETA